MQLSSKNLEIREKEVKIPKYEGTFTFKNATTDSK